jgi:selenocysteine lyase/cysteine desulfurase
VVQRARAAGARTCVDGVAYAAHRALEFEDWGVDWYAFSAVQGLRPACALLCSAPAAVGALDNLNHEWLSRRTRRRRLEPGAYPYELAWGAAAVPDYLDELAGTTARRRSRCIAAHERR